jgi:flagellar motility protein MotE (MotC chaperone)
MDNFLSNQNNKLKGDVYIMTDLTKAIIKKDIAELEDAIHEVYLSGADVTDEGSKEIARLEESIRELEALLE